jgi:hypothetical protein
MRFVMYFGAAITVLALFTMPVAPQSPGCTGNPDIDWDAQISSCTALIQSSRGTAHNRAAYNNRGAAWCQGRQRPRHCGLQRGDPARSEICSGFQKPRQRLVRQRR